MQQTEADGGGPRVGLAFCCVASCLRQISQVCVRSRKYVTGNRTKGKVVGDGGTNAKRMRKHFTGVAPVLNLCVRRSTDRKIGRSTLS